MQNLESLFFLIAAQRIEQSRKLLFLRDPKPAMDYLLGGVQQGEFRRCKRKDQLMPRRRLVEVDTFQSHTAGILIFQPMHDGFHFTAFHSGNCKEFNKDQVILLWNGLGAGYGGSSGRYRCKRRKAGSVFRRHSQVYLWRATGKQDQRDCKSKKAKFKSCIHLRASYMIIASN